jgi:hypothetical protein
MQITVQLDRFRPDENDVEGISYMLIHPDALERGIFEDTDYFVVITPAGIRYAALDSYDDEHGTFFIQYTSPVIPEVEL